MKAIIFNLTQNSEKENLELQILNYLYPFSLDVPFLYHFCFKAL